MTDNDPADPTVNEPDNSTDESTDAADHDPGAIDSTDSTDGTGDTASDPPPPEPPDDEQPPAAPEPNPDRWAGHRAGALIGVLTALLGFALVVQLRTTSSGDTLATARQDDLVRILDDLSAREDRLRGQISSLEDSLASLTTSGDRASAALTEARTRSATLGILTGTVAARGPGVRITITDPDDALTAEDLLDAIEELRAAGAEAFQVGPARIGVSSAFTERDGVLHVDDTPLRSPYVILAIGDPDTLDTALAIPGGVVANVHNAGGEANITKHQRVVISALRDLPENEYASPADDPDD